MQTKYDYNIPTSVSCSHRVVNMFLLTLTLWKSIIFKHKFPLPS